MRTECSADKTLASELAEIEGQRQRVHQVARDEEYVGFTELQEVLASEDIPPMYMERYIPHLKESDIPPSLAQHLTKEEAQLLVEVNPIPSELQPDGPPSLTRKSSIKSAVSWTQLQQQG